MLALLACDIHISERRDAAADGTRSQGLAVRERTHVVVVVVGVRKRMRGRICLVREGDCVKRRMRGSVYVERPGVSGVRRRATSWLSGPVTSYLFGTLRQ